MSIIISFLWPASATAWQPETVYPDLLAGNNTLHDTVAHLPWTMPRALWDAAFRDVCGAVGTTVDCAVGCSVLRRRFGGSVRTMRKQYKLVADRPTFPPEEKCEGALAPYQPKRGGGAAAARGTLWGWKGPRSIYFLPFYQAVFGDNFRFLHVLRDGRDVAYGDNQMQFWMLCERFYGAADPAFCDRDKKDHHQVKEGGGKRGGGGATGG